MESIIVQVQNILCDLMDMIHYQWVIIHSWRLHDDWFMSIPAKIIMVTSFIYNLRISSYKWKNPVLRYCQMIENFSNICRIENKDYAKERIDVHRRNDNSWSWDKLVSPTTKHRIDISKAISQLEEHI